MAQNCEPYKLTYPYRTAQTINNTVVVGWMIILCHSITVAMDELEENLFLFFRNQKQRSIIV